MPAAIYKRKQSSLSLAGRITMLAASVCISLVTGVIAGNSLYCQEQKSSDWYETEAEQAIMDEHYEYAIRLLQEAKKSYPDVTKFYTQLGELYFYRDFYELALQEYLGAEQISKKDFDLFDKIQLCYSYMNQEMKAIEYLEKMLKEFPPDKNYASMDTVSDLGWMYYKTHQLQKGEKLCLDELKSRSAYRITRDLTMTLGTIYSGMYDYEKSKKYYLESIEEAEEDGDVHYASVAYYNLSLLEHNFYKYNLALQYTDESIRSQDRATGHLSKGELLQSQMNFASALTEYEEGAKKDETPLTKINCAILFRLFGRLEESLQYVNSVYKAEDRSWMHSFGTDVHQHQKEVHEIFYDVYTGLVRQEALLPKASIADDAVSLVNQVKNSALAYYHKQKFKDYSVIVAKDFLSEQEYLDAFWELYRANEDYPEVALKYLRKAEEIETALIPHASVYYAQEKGKITKDIKLLGQTIDELDPVWEKKGIADSLLYMIRQLPWQSAERLKALNRLYEINPGAFLQNGLGLPLEVRFRLEDSRSLLKSPILYFLGKSGVCVTTNNSIMNEEKGYRYILTIAWGDRSDPSFILSDRTKSKKIMDGSIKIKAVTLDEQAAELVQQMLLQHLYFVKRD